MLKKALKPVIAVLIAALLFSAFVWQKSAKSAKNTMNQNVQIAQAVRGDLESVLKSSGTLLPADQEEINIKIDGTVKKVYFEEGSVVKKEDLLFELEDEDLAISLEKSELSLMQQQINLQELEKQKENTIIYALKDGIVKNVNVAVGDPVNSGTVLATIKEQDKSIVKAPFLSSQIENIRIGQKAEVMLLDPIYYISGEVIKVDQAGTPTASGGIYYYATIELDGNYYVEDKDTRVQVSVLADSGKLKAVEEVLVEPKDPVEIKPEISSKIVQILVDEGDVVKSGQKLFVLDDEDIELSMEKQKLSLRQAELDLESTMSQMENLMIYAPIDGTITELNIREGDIIRPSTSSSSNEPAAVIVDYSKMQVVLPIDELDVNKINIGMPVEITAEAVPDKVFQGKVEKIAEQGTSQNNVSIFDVTVTMEKVEELKAGMTVDAKITVAKKQNVLILPISAVQYKDGESYVMLANKTEENAQSEENVREKTSDNPYTMVKVKTGISNDEYIEIASGLKEGDKVLIMNSGAESSFGNRPRGGPMGPR